MGNRSWGKGYHEGYTKGHIEGITKGLIIAASLSLANTAMSIIGDYITTRKLNADKVAETENTQ